MPVFVVRGAANVAPFACISAPNVIVEAVKPAEDDSNAFVLRLYECEGSKTTANIRLSVPVGSAFLTNLLEDEQAALEVVDNAIDLQFKPFEIKTLKCSRE